MQKLDWLIGVHSKILNKEKACQTRHNHIAARKLYERLDFRLDSRYAGYP